MENSFLVFVFGTLKEGFPNFSVNNGQRVKGDFETKKAYPLYLIGERHSPWLILDEAKGKKLRGQVFKLDSAALEAMDKLERVHLEDGYKRVVIELKETTNNKELKAYAYVKSKEQLDIKLIKQGPLSEYKAEHAKLYRKRDS